MAKKVVAKKKSKKKVVLRASRSKKEQEMEMTEWNAKEDLSTLRRAEEITQDAVRLGNAEAIMEEEIAALQKAKSSIGRAKKKSKKKVT